MSIRIKLVSMFLAAALIPTLFVGIITFVNYRKYMEADQIADLRHLAYLLMIILAALLISAGIMACYVAKSISDPISRLVKGAEIIGSGNLDYKVGTNLKDEIGRLSRSFDKMTGDLKKIGAARDAERRRFYDVLETLPVYVALLTEDHRVPFANKFFRERFGESGGKRCHAYLFNRAAPCENCETYKVLKTGQPHHWEWTGPDGRNYDIHDFPFTDTDGERMILEMGIDITELKKAEAELRRHRDNLETLVQARTSELETSNKELARSNENLIQFAYVASHDLQEPLRVMANYSQLLEKRYKEKLDKDADDFIGFIVDAAKRMQKLITDLLEYSRAGRKDATAAEVDCNAVVRKVIASISESIKSDNASITHDDLPVLTAPETGLVQLFQNLIGNALKFHGHAPAAVHIAVRRDKNEWVFAVRDNGIGIEPQYQERIFQIFQRLHSRIEYPGTGIGLAICKKIVENLGGRIWVESELGQGATFYFTIPT